jgi:hypothetical protein
MPHLSSFIFNKEEPMRTLRLLGAVAILFSFCRGAAAANYQIEPILRLGDQVGSVTLRPDGFIRVGTLNDQGHLAFVGQVVTSGAVLSDALFQYSAGGFTLVRGGGAAGPGGTWAPHGSMSVGLTYSPVSMNQHGDIAFAATLIPGPTGSGTSTSTRAFTGDYLWLKEARVVTPIAPIGMPVGDRVFVTRPQVSALFGRPTINSQGEIALAAGLPSPEDAARDVLPVRTSAPGGLFLRSPDGSMAPLVLPGQVLPGGGKLLGASYPVVNDAGRVAFLGRRFHSPDLPQALGNPDQPLSGYLWEKGELTPVALVGATAPGGGKIRSVRGVWVNNRNRNVLVLAERIIEPQMGAQDVLYLWNDGQLKPVVTPGQQMPGGGRFWRVSLGPPRGPYDTGVSYANELGQHAFFANVSDEKGEAAYRMDVDGTLSLILKRGAMTEQGRVTRLLHSSYGSGIALNGRGQVALAVQFDRGRPALVLLTPVTP